MVDRSITCGNARLPSPGSKSVGWNERAAQNHLCWEKNDASSMTPSAAIFFVFTT